MAKGVHVKKSDTQQVAARMLDGLDSGGEEMLADEQTEALKRSLSTCGGYSMRAPDLVITKAPFRRRSR
jgi:hypothetical protein